MIGLACARPGIGVCQRTFSPVSKFQFRGVPSCEAPLACGPRNCGQFTSAAPKHSQTDSKESASVRKAGRGFIGDSIHVDEFVQGENGLTKICQGEVLPLRFWCARITRRAVQYLCLDKGSSRIQFGG